jgi:CubicO group peptidase (beta-lactamase class C family)
VSSDRPRARQVTQVALITRSTVSWRDYDAAGHRLLEPVQVPDLDSPFPVGSVSKLITALAILLLTDRNELDIDESARTVRESAGARRPSLRDLLAHSSGLSPWQGLSGQFRASNGPGIQWSYSAGNYMAAAAHAALRLGEPFDAIMRQVVADACGLEFLGRLRGLPAVPGYEVIAPVIRPVRVSCPCPTGASWFAHGMMASWRDLVSVVRQLLCGGTLHHVTRNLRQPYSAESMDNPFQGIGARILYFGGARWTLQGGHWLGHRTLVVSGGQTALVAHSCYHDRTSTIRNIARSVLTELAVAERGEPVELAGGVSLDTCRKVLGLTGSPLLSLPARGVLGSSVRLTCAHGAGLLAARRGYALTPAPDPPYMWQFRAKGENRLLFTGRARGILRIVLERPACVLEARP